MRDHQKTKSNAAALAFALFAPIANADRVVSTEFLCVLAGRGDTRTTEQSKLELYGTDLGITYARAGKLEILFGDTWANDKAAPPNPSVPRDDAFGTIDLTTFPDGDAVEAHCKRGAAPPVTFDAPSSTQFATLDPGVAMDGLKTPLTAFATGNRPRDREFAVFVTGKPIACATNADCGEFICDTGLGYLGKPHDDMGAGLTLPCIDDSAGCTNQTRQAATSAGFCRDPGSSIAQPDTEVGRKSSVVLRHRVGVRSVAKRDIYDTQEWATNRFINQTAATVDDFDAARVGGAGNDYRAADGIAPEREKVFVWGRPWWNSVNSLGHNLHLYFAYIDVPSVDASNEFRWQPNYFTGIDREGRALFSKNPSHAAALDLSAGNGSSVEQHDIVAQMSVRFVPQLNEWVMLYGGGTQLSEAICSVPGANCDRLNLAGAAIRMRTAAHPWGPWSLPVDVLVGGDPRHGAIEEYAPGGILHHPKCVGTACAPHTPPLSDNETGALYGANLIDQWTEAREDGAVDLYWNVSTWDPYRVVLMKTRVRLATMTR